VSRILSHKCLALLLALCIAVGSSAYAAVVKAPDYFVHAAMMRVFTTYLEWPDRSARKNNIAICVYGDSKIISDSDVAESYRKNPPSPDVTLSVQAIKDWHSAAKNCQILFIDASEEKKIPDIIAGLKGAPVLTISNAEGFVGEGGMIEFVSETLLDENGKVIILEDGSERKGVRYIISRTAINAAGINITNPDILATAKARK
jgi:hypothetical protein